VLEVNTREKCLDDMETMLDELAKLVSAQTKASCRSGEYPMP
jgi:hypothetical protein